MSGWKPIETHVGPAMRVLLLVEGAFGSCDYVVIGTWIWERHRWVDDRGRHLPEPTHWMPLPEPPAQLAAAATNYSRVVSR